MLGEIRGGGPVWDFESGGTVCVDNCDFVLSGEIAYERESAIFFTDMRAPATTAAVEQIFVR